MYDTCLSLPDQVQHEQDPAPEQQHDIAQPITFLEDDDSDSHMEGWANGFFDHRQQVWGGYNMCIV